MQDRRPHQRYVRGWRERVRSLAELGTSFPVSVGLHQDSELSPFIFVSSWTQSRGICREKCQKLLFADDILLIAEPRNELYDKLNFLSKAIKHQGLRVNRWKTTYMECVRQKRDTISMDCVKLNKVSSTFKYLGSTVHESGYTWFKVYVPCSGKVWGGRTSKNQGSLVAGNGAICPAYSRTRKYHRSLNAEPINKLCGHV